MATPNLALDTARIRLAIGPLQAAAMDAVGFDWGGFARSLDSLLVSSAMPAHRLLALNVDIVRKACQPREVAALGEKFDWDGFVKGLGSLLVSGDLPAESVPPK